MSESKQNFSNVYTVPDQVAGITGSSSIFVGDLAQNVTDEILLNCFYERYSSATNAKVIRDSITGETKGYGFVRFGSTEDGIKALNEMQGFILNGRKMTISTASTRGLTQRTMAPTDANDPNNTTLYVGGIDETQNEDDLTKAFVIFGRILYVKIPTGKKCGFVQFARRKDAERALSDMNGSVIGVNRVRVSWGRSSTKMKNGTLSSSSLYGKENSIMTNNDLIEEEKEKKKIEEMKKKQEEYEQQQLIITNEYNTHLENYYKNLNLLILSVKDPRKFDKEVENDKYIQKIENYLLVNIIKKFY
jgi:RNA recognition motif-containing protein